MTSVPEWFHYKYFEHGTIKIKDGTPVEERRKLEAAITAW